MADLSGDDGYSHSSKRIKTSVTDRPSAAGAGPAIGKSKADLGRLISIDATTEAAGLVADLFAASRTANFRSNPPATGFMTPSPTLSSHVSHTHVGEERSPQPKRQVSGPGEFTPRALLKAEEEFEGIGIDAGAILAMRGDSISWWLAEQIIWIHQYLENPQKGRPASLDARPKGRIKTGNGGHVEEVNHCCPKGGVTHLKPCNMSQAPPASEAFAFAVHVRDDLLPQHHASKGGINTIAFVGDIVLDKLAGCSKIDEEEFKLVAGSENIRNFFGRGYKRYKSSEPQVDPTKQPILLLKSLKKASQSDMLVTQLKASYAWALANYQRFAGPPSPGNQLLPFASVVSAISVNKPRPTPIKPAPTIKTTSGPTKKDAQRRHTALTPSDAYQYPVRGDTRSPAKLGFPLVGLPVSDSAHSSRIISEICDLLASMFQGPLFNDSGMPSTGRSSNPSSKGEAPQSNKRKSRHSTRRRSIDEGADLLLTLANGGPFRQETRSSSGDGSPGINVTAANNIPSPFSLESRLRMDHVLKVLIESVINYRLERQRDKPSINIWDINILKGQLDQLQHLFGLADLRCNVVVTPQHSAAILKLFRTLLEQTKPGDAGGISSVRDRTYDDDVS